MRSMKPARYIAMVDLQVDGIWTAQAADFEVITCTQCVTLLQEELTSNES